MRELSGAAFLTLALIVFGCGGGTAATQPTDDGTGGSPSLGGGGPSGGSEGTILSFGGSSNGAAGGGGGAGPSTAVCGNGVLETGEGCDDSNTVPGDGCSGACRVEFGWVCPTPGQPCQPNLVCGDGQAGPNQACDDGNTTSGDGCSSSCQVENGYACSGYGPGSCTPTTLPPACANSKVEAGETCDDGNATAGDGCSATCQLEAGWTCPQPGAACEKNEYCGDGVLNGTEGCDDGNLRAGDCCSATCTLEPNCQCTTPNPPLNPPHQVCSSTVVCGDGKVGAGETCDDGNKTAGDGCSSDCTNVEPGFTCPVTGGRCSPAVDPCGNAQADSGEECDDGNKASGDGCSANCKVEPGYVCPTVGRLCQPILFCGDGSVTYPRGENCDDKNTTSGDGCSATCHIEPNWVCTGEPSVCTYDVKCGDKRVTGPETCDDGNTTSGDGCSSSCQLESGYACPIVGAKCKPLCGDGRIMQPETCDDNNTTAGDGCSPGCQVEPGWSCAGTPSSCKQGVCGNGVVEAGEACDDGNTLPFDGCSPTCINEPRCGTYDTSGNPTSAVGPCRSVCGDGILLRGAGEQCDDGNTTDGDGCSHDCKVEAGYQCPSAYDNPPPSVTIPIVYRDFRTGPIGSTPQWPDYATQVVAQTGIVNQQLAPDRKPVYAGTDAAPIQTTTGLTNFNRWYHDSPGYNIPVYGQTLTLKSVGGGVYSMDSRVDEPWYTRCGFWPLEHESGVTYTSDDDGNPNTPLRVCARGDDSIGYGRQYLDHNGGFTSELRYWFEYRGGEVLRFSGDDDVWVFINGRLAVDLGGIHPRLEGSVTLSATGTDATYQLTQGNIYEAVVFQAERDCCDSNYWLTLGNFQAGKSICTPNCGDGILTGNEACDLGKDANGNNLNTGAYGGCTPDCQLAPFCGDGIVQANYAEQCDDGSNATPYGSQSGCARGCVFPPRCGDGKVDTAFGEVCDAGSSNAASAYGAGSCTTSCQPGGFCGDGFQNGSEQCDDGANNGALTSRCSTTCLIKCGDGIVEAGEQCDFGTGANFGGYNGCNSNCTSGPYCGDGIKNGTEQCDDGKNDGSYGTCMPNCYLAPYCGDGSLQSEKGELCDNGAANSATAYGRGQCTPRCRPAPFCGDNAVDTAHGETCDDGADNSDSRPGACKTDCSGYNPPPPTCGNGAVDSGEQCDDGPGNGTASSLCDQRCHLKCGNGFLDPGEQCDDGINDGSYGTCAPNCRLGPYCGDGTKNGPEQCDLGSGNQADPYGTGTCTLQCVSGPYCGDGRTQSAHEQCDGQAGCDAACLWTNPT